MRRRRFSASVLTLGLVVLVSISILAHTPLATAEGELNLPSGVITIEVRDGNESYFDTILSNVPPGYDVNNSVYPGWCVDVRTDMTRSPATHDVRLYSSLAAPGELAAYNWSMINYILNHKQGVALDIQEAIWYFEHMDGTGYVPTRPTAWTIINDALTNGAGFVPEGGQVVAVICYPLVIFPGQPDVQISIIEVLSHSSISEFPSVLVLVGCLTATLLAVTALNRRLKNPKTR